LKIERYLVEDVEYITKSKDMKDEIRWAVVEAAFPSMSGIASIRN
jgi:hypothetical protein